MGKQSAAEEPSSRRRTSGRTTRSLKTKSRAEKELLVHRRVVLLDDKEDDQPLKKLKLDIVEKSDEAKIRDTLRCFNKHYLHFVQEEEERCKKVEPKPKATAKGKKQTKNKKGKNNDSSTEVTKNKVKRPDLKTVSKMMENKETLYPSKIIGTIPGIEVGHQFYSRAEMVAVGFHSHWLNGIDYMGQAYCKGDYKSLKFPLAVAIVLSGMYEDDLDNANDVVYTGQGGHNLNGDKRQNADQIMKGGNLALKNAVEQGVPVRVVRGHTCRYSYTGKLYTYDGLYKVVRYWADKGISGFTVFKYGLQRLEGQPVLTTDQVKFINGRVPKSAGDVEGLISQDISDGQEKIPIPATNLVDIPPVPPTGFTYHKSLKLAKNVKVPSNSSGCDCKGSCGTSRSCSCAKLNGGSFPYVQRDGGRLIEAKDVVFECGPECGCGPDCVNRVSQQGLKFKLEVFRTPNKGWGVRSWDFIPSGAPICEYTGVVRKTEDVDNISCNDYIFDIDCLQTMNSLGRRERRSKGEGASSEKCDGAPEYCIDAGSSGNVARFINHSCGPNLFVQCVLVGHSEMKLARVMLFAADNIRPLEELTYDYGYELDSVLAPDGTIKKMFCYCGAADCRKRLF